MKFVLIALGSVAVAVATFVRVSHDAVAYSQAEMLPNVTELKWALQVGGPSFALNFVLLWFYWKQFKDQASRDLQRDATLVALVKDTAAASTKHDATMDRLCRGVEALLERRE